MALGGADIEWLKPATTAARPSQSCAAYALALVLAALFAISVLAG
jgi:hypothetical protein